MSAQIVRGGAELIDELEPLWLALIAHHHEVAPQLGPLRAGADSWARRRAAYERWLGEPDAFVLVAREQGATIGYALVRVTAGSPTWAEPERAGEVETLSLLPRARGRGLGRALLDRAAAELAAIGVDEMRLTAVATNHKAIRFYQREGFETAFVSLRRRR